MRTSPAIGDKGPDAQLPGFDITAYWARSGLLSLTRDAGAPPTLPVAGSGDHATAVSLYSAIVTALYRRERTGKGSYVTTSLLAAGVWAAAVAVQAALADATFFPLARSAEPAERDVQRLRAADDTWFVIVLTPDKWPALANGIGRPDLLTDARFADPAKLVANSAQLTAILDRPLPRSRWRTGARCSSRRHSPSASCARPAKSSRTRSSGRTTLSFRSKALAGSSSSRSAAHCRFMASPKCRPDERPNRRTQRGNPPAARLQHQGDRWAASQRHRSESTRSAPHRVRCRSRSILAELSNY